MQPNTGSPRRLPPNLFVRILLAEGRHVPRFYQDDAAELVFVWLSRLNETAVLDALRACPNGNEFELSAWAAQFGFDSESVIRVAALLREVWEENPHQAGRVCSYVGNIQVSSLHKEWIHIDPEHDTIDQFVTRMKAKYREVAKAQGVNTRRGRKKSDWQEIDRHVKWFVLRQVRRASWDCIAGLEPDADSLPAETVRKGATKVADVLGVPIRPALRSTN